MKNIIFIILLLVGFTSCSKAQDVRPEDQQWITFTVSCKACTLEITDPNKVSGITTLHLGGWISYTYENKTSLDSVNANVYVSHKIPYSQEVYLEIKENLRGNMVNIRRIINPNKPETYQNLNISLLLKE